MISRVRTIPTLSDLQIAYDILLHKKPVFAEPEDLVRFCQWSRFDPRLAEICVSYISQNWKTINPMKMHEAVLNQSSSAVLAVLFEFSRKIIEREDRSAFLLFEKWRKLISLNMQKACGEQFFIGIRELGGNAMQEDAIYSSDEFRRWGFLSRENLIPKSVSGSLSPSTRNEILKTLLSKSQRIRIDDYWNSIGKCISRRQAERDLKTSVLLQAKGKTKGKYYISKKTKLIG